MDDEALATTDELAARLPFDMSEDELREANGALEDLSDDARHYGKASWVTTTQTPRPVKNLILRAAVRHMKNYEGYTSSRAGDESVSWTDRKESAGSAYFTKEEKEALRRMSFRGGLSSAPPHSVAHAPSALR